MAPPAGPCEWCGGPQIWTVHADEMYVKCKSGCVSLFPEERYNFPHPNSEESLMNLEGAGEGTILRMGGVPRKGGAASTGEKEDYDLPF